MNLEGMTWSHPRGVEPLRAASRRIADETGILVDWDARSLQDFEHFPLEDLAQRYDLVIVDHPHVGDAIRCGAIAALDTLLPAEVLARQEADCLPVIWNSYRSGGHVWALPVDAATQVSVWRPGRLKVFPDGWDAILDEAGRGHVLVPLRSPHALMSLYSIMANAGRPWPDAGPIDESDVEAGLETLSRLIVRVPDACDTMDPIDVHEALATGTGPDIALLCYGYSSYGRDGFRPARLRFADMPGPAGPRGTTLGGTGLAVSLSGSDPSRAAGLAALIASPEWQLAILARNGGQPSSLGAIEDRTVDDAVNGFWRDTRRTLQGAWVRPRHAGYVGFQEAGSNTVLAALRGRQGIRSAVGDLADQWTESLARRG